MMVRRVVKVLSVDLFGSVPEAEPNKTHAASMCGCMSEWVSVYECAPDYFHLNVGAKHPTRAVRAIFPS